MWRIFTCLMNPVGKRSPVPHSTAPSAVHRQGQRRSSGVSGQEAVANDGLYAAHKKVYPREVRGFFARMRWFTVLLTLGTFYVLPWLQWGAKRQAFLIDLPARKFNFFAWTFWPQDLIYLTAVLILSAFSLFLFTAIAGRVWCGYSCPQTVWTEVFLWFERIFEGDRPARMKLDARPLSVEKIARKGGKHAVWILFSLWTGFTFVGYFVPVRALWGSVVNLSPGDWEMFWILFYGLATYGNAGFLREQVCLYMCPYARFQGVMFDRDTLVISYDAARGEPRGSRRRGSAGAQSGLGDCIDCTLCVQACPTGIDIRQGLQSQCIGCAACIDVCETVMARMDYPRGLIRYTTENALEGRTSRILRPRVVMYSIILLALSAWLITSVLTRIPVRLDVFHDRHTLYRQLDNGAIENVYMLRIMNMDSKPHEYRVSASGLAHMQVRKLSSPITVAPGGVKELPLRLVVPDTTIKQPDSAITIRVSALHASSISASAPSRFLAPVFH